MTCCNGNVQAKLYAGYKKAAARLGAPYQFYRPLSATAPLSTLLLTQNAALSPKSYGFEKMAKHADYDWCGMFDGTLTRTGDYLVGVDGTFFIGSQFLNLPIMTVKCNRTLRILRPQQQSGVGAVGYGGNIDAVETVLMQDWPASVLAGTKGDKSEANLPGDVKSAWWAILLPSFAGVLLRSDDIITDDLDRRYVVSSAELTDLGWRLTAMQAQT